MSQHLTLRRPSASPPVDPFSRAFLAEPWPSLEKLRDDRPAVWLDQYEVWAIARDDVVRSVLDDDIAATREQNIIDSVLTQSVAWQLEQDLCDTAVRIVDRLLEVREFDGVSDLTQALATMVLPAAFGVEVTDETERHFLECISSASDPQQLEPTTSRSSSDTAVATQTWAQSAFTREALVPHSIGAALYDAAQRAGLSTAAGERFIRNVVAAAVDAISNAIPFALDRLASEPTQWNLLLEHPSLAPHVIDESVRHQSPIVGMTHTTRRSICLGDVEIPAGDQLLLLVAGANRDPRKWPNPDRFDIRRPTSGHLGFGVGVAGSVGSVIGRLHGLAIVNALRRRVRRLESGGPTALRLGRLRRGIDSLPLVVDPN